MTQLEISDNDIAVFLYRASEHFSGSNICSKIKKKKGVEGETNYSLMSHHCDNSL